MVTLYKLTDQEGYTQRKKPGETQWYSGKTLKLPVCVDPQLCSVDVVHAYRNSNLALLLNPLHANIQKPLLWEAEGEIVIEDWGKVGCFVLTTTQRLKLPDWYLDNKKRQCMRIQFAVLCAEAVLSIFETKYPSDDRPRKAIKAAREYLATNAARAAAYAARAAAYAADTIDLCNLADIAAEMEKP